jgi:formylglycine-generating enzyme required for sulfatase activity
MWAEKNGYTFANKGREGHDGKIGAKPTSANNEPVTNIDWHDVVLWSNAKSAKEGLTPVYISRVGRKPISKIIGFENTTVDLSANGYRLPTSNEWEMAARWLGTTAPKKGSLAKEKITTKVGDVNHYWTPGNYASGAVENVLNKKESARVAWYDVSYPMTANSIIGTRAVGRKAPNALGMYDVSGNVWEITDRNTLGFDMAAMAINGGSMNYEVEHLSVSYNLPTSFNSKGGNGGFRLLKAVK